MIDSQRGNAIEKLKDICLVRENVYGDRPRRFTVKINVNSATKNGTLPPKAFNCLRLTRSYTRAIIIEKIVRQGFILSLWFNIMAIGTNTTISHIRNMKSSFIENVKFSGSNPENRSKVIYGKRYFSSEKTL